MTRKLLLTVVAALLAVLATAGQAGAHTSLSSTTPVENATVSAPAEVVLTFVDAVTVPRIVVLDAKDGHHEQGRARVVDNKVSIKIDGTLAGGGYRVGWRAVSPDGHPIGGEYAFTVQGGPVGAGPVTAVKDTSSSGGSGLLWLGLGGVALVLVVAGVIWARRVPGEEQETG